MADAQDLHGFAYDDLTIGQTLRFLGPVHPGEVLTVTVTVRAKHPERRVELDCLLAHADGRPVAEGIAEVTAPARRISADDVTLPALTLAKGGKFRRLLDACARTGPLAMDNAVDAEAARTKGIVSMVAGRADDAQARMISAALAVLYAHWRRTGTSLLAEAAP